MPSDVEALAASFVLLDPRMQAHVLPVAPGMYEEIVQRFDHARSCVLISEYAFSKDWPVWECHPHGDEMLYLLAGSADLHMREHGETRVTRLEKTGHFCLIPKGIWHTAKIVEAPCRILFITPGEGTQNAEQPGA